MVVVYLPFCYQVSLMISNSPMPHRFHFHITLWILAVSTLPLTEIICSRSHLTSRPTNYVLFPDSLFFLLTALKQLTTHGPRSFLCIRCFRQRFQPCVRVWFRYKWDAKVAVTKHICPSDLPGKRIPDLLNQKAQWCDSEALSFCQIQIQRPIGMSSAT